MNSKSTMELVGQYKKDMVLMREEIHRHPELSQKEFQTTKRIKRFLLSCGIELMDLKLETGCVGVLRGSKPGPVIGLREDIDALPITEKTSLPFASCEPGIMHACGHDIHQTVLMYTAKILSEIRDTLAGTVLFLFQPAEEDLTGAKTLLKSKFYEIIKPDFLLGLHCSPEWDAGTIGVIKGPANASSDFLKIVVNGIGGHGAHPEDVVDPVMIAAYLITELQTVISRVNRPVYPAVLTFGSIHGGTAGNVVPDSVEIIGTLRSLDSSSRKIMHENIDRIVEHGAAALRGNASVFWKEGMPPLINDSGIIDRVVLAAEKTIGRNHIHAIPYPSMGSDDFSWLFPDLCPGAQFRLGSGNSKDPNTKLGLHNARNVFDPASLQTGTAVMVQFVRDYLSSSVS